MRCDPVRGLLEYLALLPVVSLRSTTGYPLKTLRVESQSELTSRKCDTSKANGDRQPAVMQEQRSPAAVHYFQNGRQRGLLRGEAAGAVMSKSGRVGEFPGATSTC